MSPKEKQLKKEIQADTAVLKQWLKDINTYTRLPDSEYKFKQLDNAINAVHTYYISMYNISQKYQGK